MDTFGASIGVLLSYFLILYFKGNLRMIFLLSLIPAFLGILFLFLVKERAFGNKLQEKEKVKFNWAGLDRRLKIFLIFSFIFSLGNSSNQFLLLRAKNMGNPLTTVILLYLVYNLTYALASYPASRLSDKIGRKKILVAGYIFYAIVYFGFAVNNSLNTLWLLFALYGLYIGFTEGVEKALIIDISPSNLRATTIGLHATVVGIALLPASLLAGILWNVLGASAPFYFGGLMGLAASIGFWFILRGL
jgi:MFS family permease